MSIQKDHRLIESAPESVRVGKNANNMPELVLEYANTVLHVAMRPDQQEALGQEMAPPKKLGK